MDHLGGWRQERGPRVIEMSDKCTKEGSMVASEGWLLGKHGGRPEPVFCACLIGNFREVRVGFQVSEDIVGVPTAQAAEASVDPQDLAGEARPIGTLEGDIDGLGFVGDAAPVVRAYPTVLGPVGACADTAGEGKIHGCLWLVHGQTLLPFLDVRTDVHVTGPEGTEAALLLRPAAGVAIRDPCGDSQATAGGTGAPWARVGYAVPVPGFDLTHGR